MDKNRAKQNLIRKDAEKAPLMHVIIVTLFAVGFTMLPVHYLFGLFITDEVSLNLASQAFIRIVVAVFAIVYCYKYGFNKLFTGFNGVLSLVLVVPALLVSINNAPIIGLATGAVQIVGTPLQIVLFVVYCISVGVFEEVVFRGIIFPLFLLATKTKKNSVFLAVLYSSLLFGLVHIVNLFSGSNAFAVIAQIGYTFLIGAMCAISLYVTGNLLVCILLHTVYDLGGMMITCSVASGYGWDTATVIITVVLGVIVATYMSVIAVKAKPERINRLIKPSENADTEDKSSTLRDYNEF